MSKKSKIKVEDNTISGTTEDIVDVLEKATERSNNKYARIQLKKAKIKDSLFLEVEYSETIADGTNTVKKDCTAPIHDDLKNAFAELNDHLTRICEQWTSNSRYDEMQCKGFSIGGSGDHEGVTLFGSREIKYGVLNIPAPFIKWDSEYENIDDLSEAIETCKHEVKLYLFEGKHKPEAQQKIDFPELSSNQYDEEE